MSGSLIPNAKQQFLDANGNPLAGGFVYYYIPSTTTFKNTYQNAALTILNTNPIILDSAGECIAYGVGSFRQIVTDVNGNLIWDQPTISLATNDASSVIYTPPFTNSVAETVTKKLSESVSVKDFGAVGDGVADDTTAIQNARNFIAGNATRYKLIFPSGIYKYSVSPNWAIQDAVIEAQGEVFLRYTGTDNAVIIDSYSGYTYNLTMTGFIVQAPSTALNGVFVKSVHHSKLGFNVRGCGSASAGMLVNFAVATEFYYVCSVNEDGWYLGAKPAEGLNLSIRSSGEFVSYCLFNNCIVEGPTVGIQLLGTLGNVFIGGTSEGCTQYGLYASAGANDDVIFGMDFETNTIADIYCLGSSLSFIKCDSTNKIAFGTTAFNCTIDKGSYSNVLIDSGATNSSAINLKYNRLNNSSTFVDDGTNSFISNVLNGPTNSRFLTGTLIAALGTITTGTTGILTVTVAGAKLGDTAIASYSTDISGLLISAIVTSLNTVNVYFFNNTGSSITPTNGTCKVNVFRQ